MKVSSSIRFHNLERSPAVEAQVSKFVDSLAHYYDRVEHCDVTIEAPHHHKHHGNRYKVIIRMTVPGDTLVISHENETTPSHEDCYVTVHDAFKSARRRLQDFARKRRHQVKGDDRAEKRAFLSDLD